MMKKYKNDVILLFLVSFLCTFFSLWWSWYLINANLRESHVGIWHGAECNMTNISQAFLIKQLVTYFICQKNIHPIFFISFFIGKIYTFASYICEFFIYLYIFKFKEKIFFNFFLFAFFKISYNLLFLTSIAIDYIYFDLEECPPPSSKIFKY